MRWESLSRVNPAPGFIAPCLPTVAARVPTGTLWIHEIKHDGYRLLLRKSAGKVRIYTRRGADWTHRFPLIVEGASQIRAQSFYMDGEGVICGDDGIAIFDELHSKANDHAVFLYAFDLLELDDIDLRPLPLEDRKRRLRALLAQKRKRIVYNDHLKGDGEAFFTHACKLGCEGIVSKRSDLPYRSGRTKSWLKIKNPNSPAVLRIEEGTF
jgi:bifunctional non-homologous end joining protein LigD